MITAAMTTEAVCNLCGLSCGLGVGEHRDEKCGLIDATVVGGYESTPGNGDGALDDMVRHRFSLCEFCLDWLFARFVVPVAVDDPMNDYVLRPGESEADGVARMGVVRIVGHCETPPWRPAAQRVEEDAWRKQKSQFFAESKRRAEARDRRAARGTTGGS